MLRRILGPVAATTLVAAVGVPSAPAVAVPPPAAAAGACGSTGVTAVVDFNGLGGNQETVACDPGGGGRAASVVFRDAGYTLTYSQAPGMNGFVCQVQGQPTDGDCAQDDSFWSLWWTDGESGRWVFSSQGVGTLDVPDGGAVAFAWHEGAGNAQAPDVAAPVHASSTPSSTGGSGSPGGRHHQGSTPATPTSPTTTGSTGTPSATPTSTPTAKKGKNRGHHGPTKAKRHRHPATAPTPSASSSSSTTPAVGDITAGPPPATTGGDSGSSFPIWLGVGIAVVVLGAAVAVPVLRRRAG